MFKISNVNYNIFCQVSLRYQSIEDPEMQIYCTLSGFLIIKVYILLFSLIAI